MVDGFKEELSAVEWPTTLNFIFKFPGYMRKGKDLPLHNIDMDKHYYMYMKTNHSYLFLLFYWTEQSAQLSFISGLLQVGKGKHVKTKN